jgi:hypothetical protein
MGEMLYTSEGFEVLRGQLYCHFERSIQQLSLRYREIHGDPETSGGSEFPPEAVFEIAVEFYLEPEELILPYLTASHPFREALRELGGPVIVPRFASTQMMRSFSKWMVDREDFWGDEEGMLHFHDIPWSYAPGWRKRIRAIPVLSCWRPDEPPTSWAG